ncbi:MAG: factor-independent urate hydroxylase [Acidobacteriota bacterium]
MAELSWNRYGKSRIRLVTVRRPPPPAPHEIVDLSLDIQLEGAFDAVYLDGDNSGCLPTDTMKNTVYALARRQPIGQLEPFGIRLAEHFAAKPLVTRVRVAATEYLWQPLPVAGRPQAQAFVQPGGEQWTAVITRDAAGCDVSAGLTNLVVMKTGSSAFAGFPRDELTTLTETQDRLLATSITATWRYRRGIADFAVRGPVRAALLETFAAHASESVQHTLYAMGAAALDRCRDLIDITLTLPNRHHLLVDLRPFGLDNPNEVFVATDQPFGVIEATVRR